MTAFWTTFSSRNLELDIAEGTAIYRGEKKDGGREGREGKAGLERLKTDRDQKNAGKGRFIYTFWSQVTARIM